MMRDIIGFKLPPMHPITWTRDVLSGDMCKAAETTLIICGAWSLWTGRNARRHGNDHPNLRVAARHVETMVEDMICLQGVNTGQPRNTPRGQGWCRPEPGWSKVNTDASFHASNGSGASGAVIPDVSGRVLAAMAKRYTNLVDVLTGEFLAACDGLWLAAHHGCERVVLESDNLQLVNMMQASAVD
jgi:hypothetical protein